MFVFLAWNCGSNYYKSSTSSCIPCTAPGELKIRGFCLSCVNFCDTCQNQQQCQICQVTAQLTLTNQCQCLPIAYVLQTNCRRCPSGCTTCTSGTNCLNCDSAYNLVLGECLMKCPAGTFPRGSTCLNCDYLCAQCQRTDFCNTCVARAYKADNRCLPCHSSCGNCSGPRDEDCTSCSGDFLLSAGRCLRNSAVRVFII
jgi:proprotein convertase subtilisin/kexin type 5